MFSCLTEASWLPERDSLHSYPVVIVRMPILLEMKHEFRVGKNVSDKSRVSTGIQQLWNLVLACL